MVWAWERVADKDPIFLFFIFLVPGQAKAREKVCRPQRGWKSRH